MSLEQTYKKLVDLKSIDYAWNLSSHTKDVMVSMLMTRDEIWYGGSFVDAILNNNLGDAVRRADDEIINYLKHMVIAKDNFYIEQLEEFRNI